MQNSEIPNTHMIKLQKIKNPSLKHKDTDTKTHIYDRCKEKIRDRIEKLP